MADTIATISLRSKLVKIHETRRLKKSFDYLREAIARMSKVDPRNVKIDTKLSEYLMINPSKRMSKFEVKFTKDATSAKVFLAKPMPLKKAEIAKTAPSIKAEKKVEAKPAAEKKEKAPKAAKPKTEETK